MGAEFTEAAAKVGGASPVLTGPTLPGFRFLPNARKAFGRSLVLIGAEVDSAAFGAGFAVDVCIDVGFQIRDDSRR